MNKCRKQDIKKAAAAMITGCLLFLSVFPVWAGESVSASTMRLSYTEGTVKVSGGGGKEYPVIRDMRLHSGYSLSTDQNSYAGLRLDEDRMVKMDALSRGEVRKSGKKLELLLSSGGLLCDVEKPLEAEETLNIRTATMITGIRGTVLFVKALDPYTSMVYVMEGRVALQGNNPDTGETRAAELLQGQKGTVTAGGDLPAGQEVILETGGFTMEEIPGYVLMAIAEDADLRERLRAAGWDVDWMTANARRRLLEDQKAAAARTAAGDTFGGSGGKTLIDQLYQESGSDSGSVSEPVRRTITVVWSESLTVEQLQQMLSENNVVLVLPKGETTKEMPLGTLTIPEGSTLELGSGINGVVDGGTVLHVEGSLTIADDLKILSGGTLKNTGSVSVGGHMICNGGTVDLVNGTTDIDQTLTLRNMRSQFQMDNIRVGGTVQLEDNPNGGMINGGVYEGGITVKNSDIVMQGGTVYAAAGESGVTADHSKIIFAGGTVYARSGDLACVQLKNSGTVGIYEPVLKIEESDMDFIMGTGNVTLFVRGGMVKFENSAFPLTGDVSWDLYGAPVATEDGFIMRWGANAVSLLQEPEPELSTPSAANRLDTPLNFDADNLLEEKKTDGDNGQDGKIPNGEGEERENLDGAGETGEGSLDGGGETGGGSLDGGGETGEGSLDGGGETGGGSLDGGGETGGGSLDGGGETGGENLGGSGETGEGGNLDGAGESGEGENLGGSGETGEGGNLDGAGETGEGENLDGSGETGEGGNLDGAGETGAGENLGGSGETEEGENLDGADENGREEKTGGGGETNGEESLGGAG